jgi:hypothetical protein
MASEWAKISAPYQQDLPTGIAESAADRRFDEKFREEGRSSCHGSAQSFTLRGQGLPLLSYWVSA